MTGFLFDMTPDEIRPVQIETAKPSERLTDSEAVLAGFKFYGDMACTLPEAIAVGIDQFHDFDHVLEVAESMVPHLLIPSGLRRSCAITGETTMTYRHGG